MLRFSRFAAATLLAGGLALAVGCTSTDRHVFDSSLTKPVTVSVVDAQTQTTLWRLPVPPGQKLVLNLDRDTYAGPFTSKAVPASSLSWDLYKGRPTTLARGYPLALSMKSGEAKLPGSSILLHLEYTRPGHQPRPIMPTAMRNAPPPGARRRQMHPSGGQRPSQPSGRAQQPGAQQPGAQQPGGPQHNGGQRQPQSGQRRPNGGRPQMRAQPSSSGQPGAPDTMNGVSGQGSPPAATPGEPQPGEPQPGGTGGMGGSGGTPSASNQEQGPSQAGPGNQPGPRNQPQSGAQPQAREQPQTGERNGPQEQNQPTQPGAGPESTTGPTASGAAQPESPGGSQPENTTQAPSAGGDQGTMFK